jgi:hypothetical protein
MIDFESIKPETLALVLKKGSLIDLPEEYQEYYSMMELVRGLRTKAVFNNKIVTKSSIIKLLKEQYKLSDYQARRLYEDSINFFYSSENVKKEAFANLYADQVDEAASIALSTNQLDNYERLKKLAAKLRGLFEQKAPEIPTELYRKTFTIYTLDAKDIGLEPEDTKELEKILDELPDIPSIKIGRLKSEAGIPGYDFNILQMIAEDIDEYADENKKN